MTEFKPLNTKKFTQNGPALTPDFLYWKQLSPAVLVKEYGAIDYIDFSPIYPHNFAVTCSVRVQIYNPITKLVAKNISRFHKAAYGGTFGKDGRLLLAGSEEGHVKLFDVTTKSVLRSFQQHKSATHRAFFTLNRINVASFSDDHTVKIWDISSEKCIHTYNEHTDYVRAGCASPVSGDIILSGGYDHKIKMYDNRTNTVVFEVNHGSPVESLLFLPTGGIFISAGGTHVNVWDAFAGGKMLATMSQHTKTVTCLRLATNGQKLMSSSLDRKVKIYDIATYQTVHTLDFPNAVLSLGIAPNNETIAAGMVDGLISIQCMDTTSDSPKLLTKKRKIPANISTIIADEVIDDYQKKTQAKYDKWLRKYNYSKALDEVLLPYVTNKSPHITIAVLQELIHRKGLHRALAGRTNKSLASIIMFLNRYIGDHRFTYILIDVTNILLDTYESDFLQFSGQMGKQFLNLLKKLRREEELTLDFLKFHGALEIIIAGASVGDTITDREQQINFDVNVTSQIEPSEYASQKFVVNID